ncbi:hypothetical protein B0T25DRAFT_565540 [Lasiosphaeria hispida]|uniref:Nephrocystin 3-like N-terminal domain-containing protein n=1 Tax=Lasiosphaeria hispida TaxID=260671 RepID=A0AAJ0HST2_9PEZI|nr:hypothetical protein B0T25DRAFT_565540 [Lasiosphaeria hispida]
MKHICGRKSANTVVPYGSMAFQVRESTLVAIFAATYSINPAPILYIGCGKSIIAGYLAREAKTRLILKRTYNTQPSLHKYLQPLLDHYDSPAECPFNTLWQCYRETLSHVPHDFTLIVDTLDECADDAHVKTLLGELDRLGSQLPTARVILLSRYNDGYKRCLGHTAPLLMDQAAMLSDIMRFVKHKIKRNQKLDPLCREILDKVKINVQGMFLWASMMIKCLKQAATTGTQRERLGRFPAGLGAVYNQLLGADDRLGRDELDLRDQIFMLLVAAARPLSAAEISTAIALRSMAPPRDEDRLCEPPAASISDLC